MQFVFEGLKVKQALEIVSLAYSTYYSKRSFKSKGKKNSTQTLHNGVKVDDQYVVDRIKDILSPEFIDYGYRKVTVNLKREGFYINKKKVYRLMEQNKFLNTVKKSNNDFNKKIIKQKPKPTRPMEILEMDIKYVYIDKEQKNVYLTTILDTFTREVYEWSMRETMKTQDIKLLIERFMDNHLIKSGKKIENMSISFRTDNGSQFTSKLYRNLMETYKFICTYIPPATPQLNGHIESYHSTVEKLVCEKYKFISIRHAQETIERFVNTYNNKRDLSCLLEMPPVKFRQEWDKGIIGQKLKKNKLIFFFKEEDKTKLASSYKNFFSLESLHYIKNCPLPLKST